MRAATTALRALLILGSVSCVPKPSVSTPPSAPAGMVAIPSGHFWMGSGDEEKDHQARHETTVGAFFLDVTEVTVADYLKCASAHACPPASETEHWLDWSAETQERTRAFCNVGKLNRENQPINCVSPAEAEAYCRWAGKRLPTEEEWEFAARGGDGRIYPWGDAAPDAQLCWAPNAGSSTCPVGSFPSGINPFGLLDMAGNVEEWTSTLVYEDAGAIFDPERVRRGGDWLSDEAWIMRSTKRDWGSLEERNAGTGFRCAR